MSAMPTPQTPQQASPQSQSPTLPSPTPSSSDKPQTLKEKLTDLVRKRGIAAVIAYGMMEILTYSFAFIVMFLIWKKGGGTTLNKESWLFIGAGMWTINNFTRPIRIAGAFLLAAWVDRLIVAPTRRLWTRWRSKDHHSG